MAYETLLVTHDHGVATVMLNRRDQCNAMNGPMISELIHVLHELAHQSRTQVLVLQGSGSHFCAGADIHWMQTLASATPTENLEDAKQLANMLYLLHTFPKPTVALVQGASMGGGLGLLAAADIALCTKDATFGFTEVTLGIAPSTISPYVVNAIGERLARYYFLTGQRFDASTALSMHLVHACYDHLDALMSAGFSLAQTLVSYEPHALLAIKEVLAMVGQEHPSPALADKTAKHLAECRGTKEAQAHFQAFFNRISSRGQA